MTVPVLLILLLLWMPADAAAHRPFTEPARTGRGIATALNVSAKWEQVRCQHHRPHIVCTGLLNDAPSTSDAWYRFRMTVHKTAARRGYAMTCVAALGVCRKQTMRFRV